MMTTNETSARETPQMNKPRPIGPPRLDELAQLSVAELDSLYRQATPPSSIEELAGAPAGRMLSVRGLDREPSRGRIATIARAPWFPWDGKSFTAFDAHHGEGINRVRSIGDLFRFELRYEASAIDGRPCVLLDYDLPSNPWFIRKIRDELRELRPGLFLGPAMWRTEGEPALVLYFAIDAR